MNIVTTGSSWDIFTDWEFNVCLSLRIKCVLNGVGHSTVTFAV
jgi:hypothetical protein